MAMTLRLPPELEAELRIVAEEDRRSMHQAVVHAIEIYLSLRETEEVKSDPDALRSLAEAREAVGRGDVEYGVDALVALVRDRRVS